MLCGVSILTLIKIRTAQRYIYSGSDAVANVSSLAVAYSATFAIAYSSHWRRSASQLSHTIFTTLRTPNNAV